MNLATGVKLPQINTLPQLLTHNYLKYGDHKVAMRKKDLGIWQEYTWKVCYDNVKYLSLGLLSLGLKPQDKVGIVGDNDPEWYWTEFATIAAGGVAFGMFVDCTATEIEYYLQDSEAKFIFAKDQEQIDKILNIKGNLPQLVKAIYWDPKGLRDYNEPMIMKLDEVVNLGKTYEQDHPGLFEENVKKSDPEVPAVICYTSGTTGAHPKGAVIANRPLVEWGRMIYTLAPFDDGWDYLSYISPAWSTEQILGITMGQMVGMVIDFPETPDTAMADIQEVSPNFLMFTTKLWESLASQILAKISDTNPLFRFCYNLFLPIGYKMADMQMAGVKPSLFWKAMGSMAYLCLFRPLRDRFGLLRVKTAMTGGSVTSPDTYRFFRALGVNFKQWYGFTEGGTMTYHRDDDIKFESVGTPTPGLEVRITGDSEVLTRSSITFMGYYRNLVATSEVLRGGGWAYSGDAGYVDEDGHLIYYDRKKDMVALADGTSYAPQYIESRLKFSPYVNDVILLGGKDKAFVSALVNIDFANVGKWAERRHIAYTTFADLSQKPEVYDLIQKEIARVNKSLLVPARVKKFVCLSKEFDADEGELTRTRKVRRAFVEDRYKALIAAVYGNKTEVIQESEVVYRDGRKGITRTNVKIESLGE